MDLSGEQYTVPIDAGSSDRHHQSYARAAAAVAAATASQSAKATGATAMKVESFVGFVAMALAGATTNAVGAPGFATRMALILCGSFAGALAAAMFMDAPDPWARLRRGIGSIAGGFIATLAILAAYPKIGTLDHREWLLVLSGSVSAVLWLAVMWAQKRNAFDLTLDWLAERLGVKTNKRKPRQNDEHEDGGP